METAAKSRRRLASRLLAGGMFVVLAGGAVTAFGLTREIVADQEERLLVSQAEEVSLLVGSLLTQGEPSLRMLGAIAATTDDDVHELFGQSANPLLGRAQSLGVATARDGQMVVIASVGDGVGVGASLPPDRAMLAARALAADDLVMDVLTDETGATRLVAAVPAGGVVAYQESPIAPAQPIPLGLDTPFAGLRGAVYAGDIADPARLILTTEERLPLRGNVVEHRFEVGADTWLIVLRAEEPLVGDFAQLAPWLLLGGGLLAAGLGTAVVTVLGRRRSYALALVEERTAKLREAQEAAEGANQSKSEFLSRMSHELRTPLNAVLGFSQLLDAGDLNDDQRDSVDHILKGGRHLLELINEVLDITRIESGTMSLSPEAVSAGELLNDALDLVRPLADQSKIQLTLDRASCNGTYMLADRQRARQVVLNLLSNAIKYNRQRGAVVVTAERPVPGRVRLVVEDTGPGISDELKHRLFTPFDRLGAEQSEVDGSGIGLALSLRLAEAMGGTIGFESTPGRGSRFWLELDETEGPLERYERQNGAIATATDDRRGGARPILYIEDNLSNLTLVERVLAQQADVEVVTAMQGRLGIELARQLQPALILLDLHLPDIGGDEVLKRLRRDPVTASVPVVIVSADVTRRQVEALLAGGATAYLTKPIDVPELLRIVEEAMALS